MPAKPKPVDWEAVWPHYAAGIRALADIGLEFGVSPAGILKHANRAKWTRDLKARVQAKADAKVNEATVNAEVNKKQRALTATVRIEAEAEVQARIRLAHRKDIARGRELVRSLLIEAEEIIAVKDEIEAAIEEETAPRQAVLRKAVGLPQRAKVVLDLSAALRTFIAMEREAYGIEGVAPPETGAGIVSSAIAEISRRLAGIAARNRENEDPEGVESAADRGAPVRLAMLGTA